MMIYSILEPLERECMHRRVNPLRRIVLELLSKLC